MTLSFNIQQLAVSVIGALVASSLFISAGVGPGSGHLIGPVLRTFPQQRFPRISTMSSYALDKSNAKVLGVCAGLARSTGWDPLLSASARSPRPCCCSARSRSLLYLVTALVAESR